jgi:hypothetical protein
MTTNELIAAVQKHAIDNYNEGGWDYVVECWEEADIRRYIGDATTPESAIANVSEVVSLLDERRTEIMNEIF